MTAPQFEPGIVFDWREHEEALAEFTQTAEWDERRREGWGDLFVDAVDTAILSILDPMIHWGFYGNRSTKPQTYSHTIVGFPYDVIYLIVEGEILVVAYAHEKRQPEYWAHRLG